jgi:hypothetical protein
MVFRPGRGDGLAGDLGQKVEEARMNGPVGPNWLGDLGKGFKSFLNILAPIWMNSNRFEWILNSKPKFELLQKWEFELWFKDSILMILNSKPRIIWVRTKDWGSRKFEFTSWFEFKGRFEYFYRTKFIGKILKSFQNSNIDLAQERNLNQVIWFKSKDIQIPRQGFDLKDFPNLERCKPFQNRKVEIWL